MPPKESARLSWYEFSCIDNALNYIDKKYADRISADLLAIEIGLSKKKLQAGFRQRTGQTLHEYILLVRVEKSKHLLTCTMLPLKAIASLTGFKTTSHFCQVFKNITGHTPIEYRLEQKPILEQL